jgi:hypothetical protein
MNDSEKLRKQEMYEVIDDLAIENKLLRSELTSFKKQIRTAIADYISSEGCGCCQNVDAHKEHMSAIGKLLNMKKYSDKSGYDYSLYKTNK